MLCAQGAWSSAGEAHRITESALVAIGVVSRARKGPGEGVRGRGPGGLQGAPNRFRSQIWATNGYFLEDLAIFGYIWLYLAIFGYIWLYSAIFGEGAWRTAGQAHRI